MMVIIRPCSVATCARKLKVPGSSLTTNYGQRWAVCSSLTANVWLSVNRVEVVKES